MTVVLFGLSKKTIHSLQLIQNAAAWILKKNNTVYISPIFKELHCLPTNIRIDFEVYFVPALKLYLALVHLWTSHTVYVTTRDLISTNTGLLQKPLSLMLQFQVKLGTR